MDLKRIFTEEMTVKVRVIKIDNKKLTKSLFSQLHLKSPFNQNYELNEGNSIFGYVNNKGRWVIWGDSENIYKFNVQSLINFYSIDPNRDTIDTLYQSGYIPEKVKTLYWSTDELYSEYQISSVLDVNGQYDLRDSQKNIKEVVAELLQHRQIFL